ncbi:MAG: acyl--CoA ligase [Deltaproteobacteria bacterium]|nr:acyl--CoA ligase [Deltaproteobacteria bacterium]
MDAVRNDRCVKLYSELLPTLGDYVTKHAKERPNDIAIVEANTDEKVTWKDFETKTNAFAAKLLSLGLKKGDVIATSLPMLKEHVFLEYACFKIGIIFAPFDLRLKTNEIKRDFDKIKPKAYFFLGNTPVNDFRPMVKEVMEHAQLYCKIWVQFQKEKDQIIDGAVGIVDFASDIKKTFIMALLTGKLRRARKKVAKRDPCLIIFTTGSTGAPKPALLCHENILIQNIGLAVAFNLVTSDIMLVNLPPSHVGCQTEQLMTTIYGGGISCLLHIFDPIKSLEAIAKYQVTCIGQIPALFAMEWRLPNYNQYNLSSLRFAIYGGQAVDHPFLEKLFAMCGTAGTGLGLTETAGFCTYSPLDGTIEDILAGVGFDMPLCPISIREPMQASGMAGKEVTSGAVGEVCFSGPQIFLGYLGDDENTAKTISKDGFCYTGDLGSYDEKGLHFAGRSKLVIKPKGYQVFPTEVENFITDSIKEKISATACVGVPHEVFTEGIMAFVEMKPNVQLSIAEIKEKLKDIAAYKRPSHIIIMEAGEMPLNRVAKTDYMVLKEKAIEEIKKLRASGGWDAN